VPTGGRVIPLTTPWLAIPLRMLRIALAISLVCALSLAGPGEAQDAADGAPLPPAETARDLSGGVSADATEEGVRDAPDGESARAVPEGRKARALPEGRAARPLPDGVTPRSGPVDPPPARPAPARGSLLPAPLDEPLPEDADRDPDFWRERRERAESNLARIRAERHATEDAFTQACRYVGGDRCDRLRDEAWKLHRQEVAIEAYLDEGLREQCRRAGCLPGWVRD